MGRVGGMSLCAVEHGQTIAEYVAVDALRHLSATLS